MVPAEAGGQIWGEEQQQKDLMIMTFGQYCWAEGTLLQIDLKRQLGSIVGLLVQRDLKRQSGSIFGLLVQRYLKRQSGSIVGVRVYCTLVQRDLKRHSGGIVALRVLWFRGT